MAPCMASRCKGIVRGRMTYNKKISTDLNQLQLCLLIQRDTKLFSRQMEITSRQVFIPPSRLFGCVLSSNYRWNYAGMSDLVPKWVRFAPYGINPGLFQIRFQYILAPV